MASIASPSAVSPTETEAGRDLGALEFRVEPFTPRHLPLVAAFSERYWSRPRTEAYYDWRYLQSQPFSRLFVAVTPDQCLGMVFAFRKTYLISGHLTPCLEVFDWHSLPGLKGSGVGIRVMRAMMRLGDRVVAIGGTSDVLKTLPAMGWAAIGAARPFELPMSGAALVPGLRARVPFRIPGERVVLDAAARWFRPHRVRAEGDVLPMSTVGVELQALYEGEIGYDVVQVPDPRFLRWMAGYSAKGSFTFLYFTVRGQLRGWVAMRLYDTPAGREAAIVEIFAPRPDVALYTWMVSEAAVRLAAARPRLIRARATCPVLQEALLANRFRPGSDVIVHSYPKSPPPHLRLHLTLNHTDEPLRPYPDAGMSAAPAS
jgi:hypothetical protein